MPQLLWQPGDSVWKGKGFLCLPGPRAALLPSRQGLTAVPIKALLCFDGAQPLLGHVLMQPEVAKCQLSLFMLLTEDLMSYRSGRELCRVFFHSWEGCLCSNLVKQRVSRFMWPHKA